MIEMEARKLKEYELNLVKYLVKISEQDSSYNIPDLVEELKDGKMGSIRFISGEPGRKYGADLIQVEYKDDDSIPVIITLSLDNQQQLYELEFWKVDFEKLLRYPKPDEVVLIKN
jgi:hypothetical protein